MIKRVSPTMLGMWLRCGEQFRRRYIEGDIFPPGVAARSSSGVHKAAELNHLQKLATEKDLSLSDLQDIARDEYKSRIDNEGVFIPPKETSSKKRIVEDGLKVSLGGTHIYHRDIAPKIKPELVEEKITADIGAPVPIMGIIDVTDKEGVIHDLKMGVRRNEVWAKRNQQPTFYWILYEEATKKEPLRFEFQWIVPLKKEMRHFTLPTERSERDVKRLLRYIEVFWEDLQEGRFRPADPDSWICSPNWCGYYPTCKYGGK